VRRLRNNADFLNLNQIGWSFDRKFASHSRLVMAGLKARNIIDSVLLPVRSLNGINGTTLRVIITL